MRTLFKGGTVITGRAAQAGRRAGGRVKRSGQVGRRILTPADRDGGCGAAVSCSPALSTPTPTLIWTSANTTTADDFTTGSRAALRGGTTTVIDFACPNKGESLHYGLDLWHQKGRRPHLLRLRLPHDHRRLERIHPGGAAGHVRARACPLSRCI